MPAFFPLSWHPWQNTSTMKLGQQCAPWDPFWLVIPSSHCLGSKHDSTLILLQSHSQMGLKHLDSLSTHKQNVHLQGSDWTQFFGVFFKIWFQIKKEHPCARPVSACPTTVLSRGNHIWLLCHGPRTLCVIACYAHSKKGRFCQAAY